MSRETVRELLAKDKICIQSCLRSSQMPWFSVIESIKIWDFADLITQLGDAGNICYFFCTSTISSVKWG